MVEMVAVAAVAGSGEHRGSLVGGSGAAVAGVGVLVVVAEVAAVVAAAVSSRLAAGLWLALTPSRFYGRGCRRHAGSLFVEGPPEQRMNPGLPKVERTGRVKQVRRQCTA